VGSRRLSSAGLVPDLGTQFLDFALEGNACSQPEAENLKKSEFVNELFFSYVTTIKTHLPTKNTSVIKMSVIWKIVLICKLTIVSKSLSQSLLIHCEKFGVDYFPRTAKKVKKKLCRITSYG
jgi:hypothetical protein